MKHKIFISILLAIAISGWSLVAMNTVSSAPSAFDHSQCQYPNRLSNPPDGCDNSDPARPECMKFGTEDCEIPLPVEPVDPIIEQPKAEPVPIVICQ